MEKITNQYIHPKTEELYKIFNITWQQANLYKRRATINRIAALDEKEGRWYSLLNQASTNSRWFIKDRLFFLERNREQLKKHHNYLKAVYRDRSQAEKRGEEYKQTEYDKNRIREIPIARIMSLFGKNIARAGYRDDTYLCPFHNDKNASLCVTKTNNLYHCFSCQAGGDVISLYQHLAGCGFPQALKELNNLI